MYFAKCIKFGAQLSSTLIWEEKKRLIIKSLLLLIFHYLHKPSSIETHTHQKAQQSTKLGINDPAKLMDSDIIELVIYRFSQGQK